MEVQLLPLVHQIALPKPAPASTRKDIPSGYGVQEQCLPFTAATAIGFLVPSPITFGLCPASEAPANVHTFRSPIERADEDGRFEDERVFYVKDDPSCGFVRNTFTLDSVCVPGSSGKTPVKAAQPGVSFFDREDQVDLFKLHLPYIWKTPPEIDTLFLPAINRTSNGLVVLAGLVETDWYAHPVNLVVRKPYDGRSVHVVAGDPVAQTIFVARSHRRPDLGILPSHARTARELRTELAIWYLEHSKDRAAYKKLARSQHGRM